LACAADDGHCCHNDDTPAEMLVADLGAGAGRIKLL
jgi:hypothetical protein